VVEFHEQALVAAADGVGNDNVDQVPGHVPGFRLGTHLGEAAAVVE